MGSLLGNYHFHAHQIHCPGCGKIGTIQWEDAPSDNDRQLIKIEGDFYERLAKKEPYQIELVCSACGTLQTGTALTGNLSEL